MNLKTLSYILKPRLEQVGMNVATSAATSSLAYLALSDAKYSFSLFLGLNFGLYGGDCTRRLLEYKWPKWSGIEFNPFDGTRLDDDASVRAYQEMLIENRQTKKQVG